MCIVKVNIEKSFSYFKRSLNLMKAKTKQFDQIQTIMSNSTELIEANKKELIESIKWLKSAKKQLAKILDCTNLLKRNADQNLHPQISGPTYSTYERLSEAVSKYHRLLSDKIPLAKKSVNDTTTEISAIKSHFRNQITSLVSACDELYSILQAPNKSVNTQDFLEHGFSLHCQYLRYFNKLTDIQGKIVQSLSNTKELVNLINKGEKDLLKNLNDEAINIFPFILQKNANMEDIVREINWEQDIITVADTLDIAREPHIKIQDEFKFDTVKPDMEVIKAFSKETKGQIDISEGEIVTVIDASLPEFWKIRKVSGAEGEVPAICLMPKQKQT